MKMYRGEINNQPVKRTGANSMMTQEKIDKPASYFEAKKSPAGWEPNGAKPSCDGTEKGESLIEEETSDVNMNVLGDDYNEFWALDHIDHDEEENE